MTDNQDLTLQQASKYSGRSVSWLRKKILNNELSATKEKFKFGERWKVNKKDLDEIDNAAKISKEVVKVREHNKPVSKEVILKEIKKVIKKNNEELAEQVAVRLMNQLNGRKRLLMSSRKLLKHISRWNKRVQTIAE